MLDSFAVAGPALRDSRLGGRMPASPNSAASHLGRPPSPVGRIADIDATIALWERTGVDSSDAWWALGQRRPCTFGWPQVRWQMMQIAARWER